ncbi:TPA: lysogeny establishment protein [Enterobacter hormaechei subsp. xiangfangensis]|nr:lysogeny establishment protein [Enterobacter hormaechei subsp. xiangfangensis]
MAEILLTRTFHIEGTRITLTAGLKNGLPLVVLGLPDADGKDQLQNITIEYPMKSRQAALAFVTNATEETAMRGLDKYRHEVGDLAERMNQALNAPYKKDVGYRRRGD